MKSFFALVDGPQKTYTMNWEKVEIREWFIYVSLFLNAVDFGVTYQHFDYIEYTSGNFSMVAGCT